MKRSTVGNDDAKRGTKAAVSNTRTSRNAWLDDDHPGARVIRERILGISGMPNGGHEQMQVLRYERGQEYQVHHDGNKRVVTTFVYLSTPGSEGFTNWPSAGGRAPGNSTACKSGMFAHPRKGAAIFFYDIRPDMTSDQYASHAACPVGDGVKWGGTFWLHLAAAEKEDLM